MCCCTTENLSETNFEEMEIRHGSVSSESIWMQILVEVDLHVMIYEDFRRPIIFGITNVNTFALYVVNLDISIYCLFLLLLKKEK